VWSDVLLFRRALIELPSNIVVNAQPFDDYLRHESEGCDLKSYQLQPSFRLGSMRDLFTVEQWLTCVTARHQNGNSTGLLTKKFRSPEEVILSWPELVERKFVLFVSSVTLDELARNIRLRDIWNWEVVNENWELLVKEIPVLGEKESESRESRLAALDRLSPQLRAKADSLAKEKVVASHPEWLTESLSKAKRQHQLVSIRFQGGSLPFEGIQDRQDLISQLLKAPIEELSPSFQSYTQDGKHFYRIQVLDRAPQDTLVPLPDLLADGTLDHLLDRVLEASYPKIRAERPSDYKTLEGEWKSFQEVKEKLGEVYFASLLKQLDSEISEWRSTLPKYCQWDDLKSARVAVRFLPHLVHLTKKIAEEGEASVYVTTPFEASGKESTTLSIDDRPLGDLWLLVSSDQRILQGEAGEKIQFTEALSLEPGTWMAPRYSQELGPFVAQVTARTMTPYQEDLRAMVYDCQNVLGREAIQERSSQLVTDFFGEPEEKITVQEAKHNG
jgi:hypothetical protein